MSVGRGWSERYGASSSGLISRDLWIFPESAMRRTISAVKIIAVNMSIAIKLD